MSILALDNAKQNYFFFQFGHSLLLQRKLSFYVYLRLDNIVFTVENLKFHHGTNAGDISCFMSSCFLLA